MPELLGSARNKRTNWVGSSNMNKRTAGQPFHRSPDDQNANASEALRKRKIRKKTPLGRSRGRCGLQFLPLVSSWAAMRSNASAARSFARADSVHRASMRMFIARTSARSLPRDREANIDTAANVIAAPSANDTPAAAEWRRMVIIVCVRSYVCFLLPCVFRLGLPRGDFFL